MASQSITTDPVAELKRAHRSVWSCGDYADVATHIDDAPPHDLLKRVPVAPGEDVLDVATGTGNVALKAAAAGARVIGLDLTPELFVTGRKRAAEQGVTVDWIEGDAEDLPFPDASFDVVHSVFGVQFAPRHRVVAAELSRVTRPAGRIGLVNWTPEGQIGELLRIVGGRMPKPPAFASPPPQWGDEDHIRDIFADEPIMWSFARGRNPWRFASAEVFADYMATQYGPAVKARERLTAEGTWDECRAEIVAMAERRNEATDGTLLMYAEYLIAVGRKLA